jgi:hypothetical protein
LAWRHRAQDKFKVRGKIIAMLYQIINTGWPVGATLIPAGQILDYNNPTDQWAQLAKAQVQLPPNTMCLDQPAYDAIKLYPSNVRPIAGPGVTT